MSGGTALSRRAAGRLLQVPDLLPADFGLPGPVYWVPVVLLLVAGVLVLYAVGPPVTDWTAVALAPWVGVGSAFHVLYQQPAFFPAVRPLFGNPMVYLTTGTVVVFVWIVSEFVRELRPPEASNDRQLGAIGTGVLASLFGYSLFVAGPGLGVAIHPFWSALAFVTAGVLTAAGWVVLSVRASRSAAVAGKTGLVVLFGHTLDGVSTAFAVDAVPRFTERTPLSRAIIELGASLPTAEFVGSAWLFVLVKMVLAGVVVVAFRESYRDRPQATRLLLTLVAAVGLGPGVHNVLLLVVRESVGLV